MDLRLAVYELVAEHRLDPTAARRLERLAGWHEEPASLRHWLPRGVAVLAAALAGLGLIFWIAANWDTLGRAGRFTLLEGVVVLMCAAALWRPAARAPFGLLALLGIGGVFAYFGLGLALLAAAALALAMPRSFEVYGLSAVAFGLDTLLVAGLARWVFDKYHGGEPIFELLLIGLVAAGLLAASVTGVLRLARRYALEGEAARARTV